MFYKTVLANLCAFSFAIAYPITTPNESNSAPMDIEGGQQSVPSGPSRGVKPSLASQFDLGNIASSSCTGKKRSRPREDNDPAMTQGDLKESKRQKILSFQTHSEDQPMNVETISSSTVVTLVKPNFDGTILGLPPELIDKIFGYLNPSSRQAAFLTCRTFNEVMQARCKSDCHPRQQLTLLGPDHSVRVLSWFLTWKEQVYANFPHLEAFHNDVQVHAAPNIDPEILSHCSYHGPKLLIDKKAFWEFIKASTDQSEITKRLNDCFNALIKHALSGNWKYVGYYLSTDDMEPHTRFFLDFMKRHASIIGDELVGQIISSYTPTTPQSQNLFAVYFYCKKHDEKAQYYCKLAADQGFAHAQNNYALVLRNGEGGDMNFVEARRYHKLAADQGLAHAQYNYAYMLWNGEGGDVDDVEARRWIKLAADQGHSRAQNALDELNFEPES